MVLVTYQGEEGSYSEEALHAYFEARGMRGTEVRPCTTFEETVQLVEEGDAHYAFLPIENTLEGTVDEAMDVLLQSDLWVVGEMRFKVNHCLVGHAGATVEGVRMAFSHPYALRQCRDFLRSHDIKAMPTGDTAGAVREVKARGNILEAAVASERAAQVYNMDILQRGIQSREHNFTRFVALSKNEYRPNPGRDEQFLTTILLGVRHTPGALHEVLGHFAKRRIDLTKLESRPRPDRAWAYQFLIDLEGHKDDDDVAQALSDIVGSATSLQVLGSYPTWDSVHAAASKPVKPKTAAK